MEPVPKVTPLPADPDGGRVVDCAYTLAGDRMATCGAKGEVAIYAAAGTGSDDGVAAAGDSGGGAPAAWRRVHCERLAAGEEPTKLAWAPAELGSICAVGTAQGAVHILRAAPGGAWRRGGKLACGRGRVRGLAFAPAQHGLVLAVASDDGRVYVHEGSLVAAAADSSSGSSGGSGGGGAGGGSSGGGGGTLAWTLLARIDAAPAGACHCVAWRPFTAGVPPLLLAGSAGGAKAYCYQQAAWREAGALEAPDGEAPAAALHWAPTLGRPFELAAASFGADVAVFRLDGAPTALATRRVALLPHPGRVWRVEFNGHGNALGASVEAAGGGGEPSVWIWMPAMGGEWTAVSRIKGGAAVDDMDS